ncbi:hypothetical protein A2970_00465 [Candidatus Roizmanbacteria bacterium RIFCSPLOWO2_01_FULL_44_13]|uniref:LytR/CpsA/Psr regulator C-terminal domain-containing protein n=1 Tax=Candidatus Roizmanbacteria bacterium RIFCSPLOWO2_01_FULL_44_13 TaxID=1802069 RepID=A0A1F7JBY8_9BACT|nr:MAG: hypothetical protein A2970_00465 [Candidatus Roizmanbacteria bacterium RIFCSPLOWO2_01_FULL_44_13]
MVYLYLNKNVIKLIYLKKTLLGQQETSFFEKTYEADLVVNGSVANVDLLASAIKEAFTSGGEKAVADRDVSLILPQESFYFLRTLVPVDVAPTAMTSFVFDKARAAFPVSPDDCYTASFVRETTGEKVINFFGINRETLDAFRQALSLIDLKVHSVVPETLAYFKLFEKTLRAEKKENILYLTLEDGTMSGYLFDSYGLLEDKKIELVKTGEEKIETLIKAKVDELAEKNIKLNRLILSGEPSDKVRQDTFTKAVSVWTNPLKRIVPTFYDEYLKLLVVESKKTFPILTFDVCFGAFIFGSENREFSFFRGGVPTKKSSRPALTLPKFGLPKRELLLFVASFALSFLLFLAFSKIKLPNLGEVLTVKTATPTPRPSATPTPTPSFAKEDLKIQVLNGGGVAGKATDVKEILTDKGYLDIITGNADNFDYEKTELQVKKSKSQAYSMVAADLKDYITSPTQTTLAEDETADVVLIIGADFK